MAVRRLQFGQSDEPGLDQESSREVSRIRNEGQLRTQCPQCRGSLPCIYCPSMENEANRRETFEKYARKWGQHVSPPNTDLLSPEIRIIIERLASGGFFCNGEGKAECFSCHIATSNWLELTDVERLHGETRQCCFQNGEGCRNNPVPVNNTASSSSARAANARIPSSFSTPPRQQRDILSAEGNRSSSPRNHTTNIVCEQYVVTQNNFHGPVTYHGTTGPSLLTPPTTPNR